jgi:hypothetical protein
MCTVFDRECVKEVLELRTWFLQDVVKFDLGFLQKVVVVRS